MRHFGHFWAKRMRASGPCSSSLGEELGISEWLKPSVYCAACKVHKKLWPGFSSIRRWYLVTLCIQIGRCEKYLSQGWELHFWHVPLEGSQRIEAQPWQDRGHAHPVKVLSFSILSILMCCWWERGVLVLSLISACLFMRVSNSCRSSFYHLGNLSRSRKYVTKESVAVVVHAFLVEIRDELI